MNLFDKAHITNIVGNLSGNNTINSIRVVPTNSLTLWEDGYPDGFYEKNGDWGLERGEGDGTVPLSSSEFVAADLNEFDAEHGALVTKAEGLIFKKLTGRDASILITSNTDSFLDINYRILIIKILSPIDVQVIAPDLKRIGKDFATGGEFNEIDGAFYSGFETDDEYITIPNPLDGEYKIETIGTGSGEYTIATGYISDTVSVDKDFTGQTALDMSATINIEVNSSAPENFDIKPQDLTSPEIVIHDADSGVFSSEIRFDDRIVNSGEALDLFFEKLGLHKLTVMASDFVGNTAISEAYFSVIATRASTLADIYRAYALGWIFEEGIKESLVAKLKNAYSADVLEKPNLLKAFLNELNALYGEQINDRAYNLLKDDINWLVNN